MTDFDRREFLIAAGGLAAVSLMPEVLPAALRLNESLRVGLVGVGRQGRAILAELAKMPAIKVVAACDTDEARRTSAATRAPGAEVFSDHRAMLDKTKDLSAVIIATPTHEHKSVALDAVAAGKHVYCEAPLAHTVDDARAIARAASGARKVFAVGHEGRSNPVYGLARTFFKTDAFKDMISMRAAFAQKTSWRVPAADAAREKVLNWRLDPELSTGMMGEIGSHQLDVFHWYRGRFPVAVRGRGSIRLHADGRTLADTVHADLEFDDGAMLSYSATLGNSYEGRYEIMQGSASAIRLAWTHGWMFKESDAPTQGWEVYANRQQFHRDVGITLIADATKLASQNKLKDGVGLPESSLFYALEKFAGLAGGGDGSGGGAGESTKTSICTAEEGFRTAVVSILADQAVRRNTEIRIDPEQLKL
ncbi:MAG: Gfo/Idh/MocA family protein [Phycisphaerales bacterium]